MNASYGPDLVSTMLYRASAGRANINRSDYYQFLLTGANYIPPIIIILDSEIARLTTGIGIRVNIGLDIPGDTEALSEVVEALFSGHAVEYFGINGSNTLGYLGWKIWYPGGSRMAGNIPGKDQLIYTHQLASWPVNNPAA